MIVDIGQFTICKRPDMLMMSQYIADDVVDALSDAPIVTQTHESQYLSR